MTRIGTRKTKPYLKFASAGTESHPPWLVLISDKDATRLASMVASLAAIIPPIECPTMCAFGHSRESSTESTSLAMYSDSQ